jgi:RNA polymerase sigma-70 factor (ECF subfamily)
MDVNDYNDCVSDWSDALFRFARKCTGHEEDARDAVQSAYAALWEKRSQVPRDKAKSFLFQVAYHQSVNAYRRQRRVVLPEVLEDREVLQPRGRDLKRILDEALDRLDDQLRALVLLKDYEGYRYDEIGRITGLSDAQVRVYLHRARKSLKEYLVSVENVLQ